MSIEALWAGIAMEAIWATVIEAWRTSSWALKAVDTSWAIKQWMLSRPVELESHHTDLARRASSTT